MGISRTRFKNQIVTEFVPPRNRKSGKVMIFCSGVPGVPHKDEVMEFWASKGFWTFYPRYRGTWESGGAFLARSPEKDVLDVIDGLRKSFKDYWSGNRYRVKVASVTVVGTSFGGPAAILSTLDRRVSKAICLSPVVDWRAEDRNDPLEHLYTILKEGYGAAYRFRRRDWRKLARGGFYDPVAHLKRLDPRKIMILHAKDDKVVDCASVVKFAKTLGCSFSFLKRGGHLSSTLLMKASWLRKCRKFISEKSPA